ncbi:MAG: hypothetical protein INQ03_23630 [Candidatus Heimdallarchaeota archaeon]|nr:hypothetical protein [Candidatus Heimdallarchaeota archaeon]
MLPENLDELMESAKNDIQIAGSVWKRIFEDYSPSYMYIKGSAIKPFESYLDYVPVVSDLDIHVAIGSEYLFDQGLDGIQHSLNFTRQYDNLFKDQRSDFLHIPRSQVIFIDQLERKIDVIPPDYTKVQFLIGSIDDVKPYNLDIEFIKQVDRKRLKEDFDSIQNIAYSIFDRIDMDFWQLLRRLQWKVSPNPIRLLSQEIENSLPLWELNRTSIVKLLKEYDFTSVAQHMEQYYLNAWLLFQDGFNSNELYRKAIFHAIAVIHHSYKSFQQL